MSDYEAIVRKIEGQKADRAEGLDDFLIHWVADRENLNREIDKQFKKFRHAWKQLPEEWVNRLKAQYIAHRIFREGGLIGRYLKHSEFSMITERQQGIIRDLARYPWRFSYGIVQERPAESFFTMADAFTREEYLLYSPGMAQTERERSVRMWFNLIAFNGDCWETYGPLIGFSAFNSNDILFYASELNHGEWFETPEAVMADVERNPVPYMALIVASDLPVAINEGRPMVRVFSEFDQEPFNTQALRQDFKVEYDTGVYRFSFPEGEDPVSSMATVYYDEKEELLIPNAMTDEDYGELIDTLARHGFDLPRVPDFRVNMAMLVKAAEILKRSSPLEKYEKMFQAAPPDEEAEQDRERMNDFIQQVLPAINEGREPDIEAAIEEAGLEKETAYDLVEHIKERIRNLGKEE